MGWCTVATVDELQAEPRKIVNVDGQEIGIFRVDGRYYAVFNHCPHWGAPICRGRVTGRVVCDDEGKVTYDHDAPTLRCPWHHWEFDLETGRAVAPIPQRLKVYPVRVAGGEIQIDTGKKS